MRGRGENKLGVCGVRGRYEKIGLVMSVTDIGTGRGWVPWGSCGGAYYHLQPHRAAMSCYNHPTNLLEIQMKDIIAAVVIGLVLCAVLLHGLDALFY